METRLASNSEIFLPLLGLNPVLGLKSGVNTPGDNIYQSLAQSHLPHSSRPSGEVSGVIPPLHTPPGSHDTTQAL